MSKAGMDMLKPSKVLVAAADLLEKGWCQKYLGVRDKATHWIAAKKLGLPIFYRNSRAGERTPDVAYFELQKVHPFRDGNGRTGKILFCYLLNCLDAPVMPSNWFGCANP